jgi:hypothetical protein
MRAAWMIFIVNPSGLKYLVKQISEQIYHSAGLMLTLMRIYDIASTASTVFLNIEKTKFDLRHLTCFHRLIG